jgi:mannose-6-phosphate isomerase-like protein (cupin superfamily)
MTTNRLLIALAALALVSGCGLETSNPRFMLRYEKGLDSTDLSTLVARAAPGPVSVLELGRTAWVSHHLAVVREGEVPHYHRFHDLTVVVLRGEGVMDMEGKRFTMKAGDVTHVQRGVRHFFRNTGRDAAVSFVTFSPPFDGRDTVTAELPAEQPSEAPKKSWWRFWDRGGSKSAEAKPRAAAEDASKP